MDRRRFFSRLALWLTAFLWGTSFVILKKALDHIGVLWLLGLRFLGAALIFLLVAVKRLRSLHRRTFLGSVLMGLCLAGAYLFQTYGLALTTPGKNSFLTAVYCVLVPFLAWIIFGRRPVGIQVFAAVLCMAGVGLVSLDGLGGGINSGDLLTLVCGLFYALQIVIMDHHIRGGEGDAVSISAVQFSTTAAVCLLAAFLFEPFPAALTPSVWLTLLYLSAVVTALCFFLQALGLRDTSSSAASVILSFEAVFGVLTSLLFYGERMTVKLALGFALIFLSVLLAEAGEAAVASLRARSGHRSDHTI